MSTNVHQCLVGGAIFAAKTKFFQVYYGLTH